MKVERDASSARKDGERDIESNSNLLDPPIEALDKATASTKISGEQCTWPDSDRVKCHRGPSFPPSPLPRPFAVLLTRFNGGDSLIPISLVLRRFSSLPPSLPSFFFLPPRLFSFSYDRRSLARRTWWKLFRPSSIARRAAEGDRAGSSHRRSSSPSYVTHTGAACVYL